MIMAGGTGGHVYPALAVAKFLRSQAVPVIWLGTPDSFESRVVPAQGIAMEWIKVSGLRGKGLRNWVLAPLRLMRAIGQALVIIWRHSPRAVLGMGGFASGPGGFAAWFLRKPLIVHEQNAILGLTNRLLAPLSRARLSGFKGVFGKRAAVYVGNPVRQEILDLPAVEKRLGNRQGDRIRLLVLGGSQGAKALNEVLPQALRALPEASRPSVRHQAGGKMLDIAETAYREQQVHAEVVPFIDDMAEAYAWADLVICRSGALTVAELAAAGVGAILVPFPFAVDDHQTANARYLQQAGAAILLPQAEMTAERLAAELLALIEKPEQLLKMAIAARKITMPRATRDVADCCLNPDQARWRGQVSWPVPEQSA